MSAFGFNAKRKTASCCPLVHKINRIDRVIRWWCADITQSDRHIPRPAAFSIERSTQGIISRSLPRGSQWVLESATKAGRRRPRGKKLSSKIWSYKPDNQQRRGHVKRNPLAGDFGSLSPESVHAFPAFWPEKRVPCFRCQWSGRGESMWREREPPSWTASRRRP